MTAYKLCLAQEALQLALKSVPWWAPGGMSDWLTLYRTILNPSIMFFLTPVTPAPAYWVIFLHCTTGTRVRGKTRETTTVFRNAAYVTTVQLSFCGKLPSQPDLMRKWNKYEWKSAMLLCDSKASCTWPGDFPIQHDLSKVMHICTPEFWRPACALSFKAKRIVNNITA